MDKYTKFILTLIAIGIFGLNYHLFKGEIFTSAFANEDKVYKISICRENGLKCSWVDEYNQLHIKTITD
tara:strand:- start:106 stop:312 length:207 start_codon:yes stop_codon:yes gene_type:complete